MAMKITIIFPIILTIIIVESLSGFLHVKKQRQASLSIFQRLPIIISFKNHVYKNIPKLIGGLEPWNFMTFHSVGNVIIPTDELTPSFFRGVGSQPPTRFCGWLFIVDLPIYSFFFH